MSGGILALDLATTSGWARWRPGLATPAHGILRLPRPPKGMSDTAAGVEIGKFVAKYRDWLTDMLTADRPDWVVFEAPYVDEKTHQDTARKLLGIAVVTELVCHDVAVAAFEVNNAKVRTHFIRGAFLKSDVVKRLTIEECERRGWSPDDDNAADALAVLDYGAFHLKLPVPWNCGPKPKPEGETLFTSARNRALAAGSGR